MVKDLRYLSLSVTSGAVGRSVPRRLRSFGSYTKRTSDKSNLENYMLGTMSYINLEPETEQDARRETAERTLTETTRIGPSDELGSAARTEFEDDAMEIRQQLSCEPDSLVGLRLSLVGLEPRKSRSRDSTSPPQQRDELHSDLYSSVLESLRATLLDSLPCLSEGMVSRAIIGAFASDGKTRRCSSDSSTDFAYDRYQIEVNHLWEAQQWKQSEETSRTQDVDVIQKCLENVCNQIHNKELTSADQAMRILLGVASIIGLGIDESVYIPQDTILIQGLSELSTRSSLKDCFSKFGQVKSVAIASEDPGFAFCRFRDESITRHIAVVNKTIYIAGVQANVRLLHQDTEESGSSNNACTALSNEDSFDSRVRTNQTTSDIATGDGDCHVSPVCVAKVNEEHRSYWRHHFKRRQQKLDFPTMG